MDDRVTRYMQALEEEIDGDERFADELAGLAGHLRRAGYNELAPFMAACGCHLRVKAVELQGRLAAVRHQDDAS